MPSKKKNSWPDDRYVRDILKAKISQKTKLRRMTLLALRLEDDINAILTDKNYVGGVQYWAAKHGEMAIGLVRAYSMLVKCCDCAEALNKALAEPATIQHVRSLFEKLTKESHAHTHCTDPGTEGCGIPNQKPARTGSRRPKAV